MSQERGDSVAAHSGLQGFRVLAWSANGPGGVNALLFRFRSTAESLWEPPEGAISSYAALVVVITRLAGP